MNNPVPASEVFVDQIMRAIVQQFFESPTIYPPDGMGYVNSRSTPAQVVAERLLVDRQGELLDAIMEKIDLDVLGADVASKVLDVLKLHDARGFGFDVNVARRKKIQDMADEKVAELIAAEMLAKMKDQDE